jgi:deoxyribodipyrimidine photo-lyase
MVKIPMVKPVLHWFRRDLRLTDNTALAAAASACDGHVVPVYILSGWKMRHRWTGAPRQAFLCGCLHALAQQIARIGGRLVIRQGGAVEALERLLDETGASAIYFNRDPDPFGRALEARVAQMAAARGVAALGFKDAGLHERDEILTGSGRPYRVFTPYARAWLKQPKPAPGPALGRLAAPPRGLQTLPPPTLAHWGLRCAAAPMESIESGASGEPAARKRLDAFLAGPVFEYGARRDFPAADATSRLSADLRHGTVSIREVYARCAALCALPLDAGARRGVATFVNELAWRDFYRQILWHWPEVLEHAFNPKTRSLNWRGPDAAFRRWCDGETGFPIVDAAMRQLNATGWMHNRLRMIAAMFLTKDLHIDWRHGERYFMQRLIDGDIAANNGGWQWSAGTGADAAPYFRIQNPWTQTGRYDPDGAMIKRWIPELRDVPPKKFTAPPPGCGRLAKNYPAPMVDHAAEREAALEFYKGLLP